MTRCLSDTEFLAKLHCVRLAMTVRHTLALALLLSEMY